MHCILPSFHCVQTSHYCQRREMHTSTSSGIISCGQIWVTTQRGSWFMRTLKCHVFGLLFKIKVASFINTEIKDLPITCNNPLTHAKSRSFCSTAESWTLLILGGKREFYPLMIRVRWRPSCKHGTSETFWTGGTMSVTLTVHKVATCGSPNLPTGDHFEKCDRHLAINHFGWLNQWCYTYSHNLSLALKLKSLVASWPLKNLAWQPWLTRLLAVSQSGWALRREICIWHRSQLCVLITFGWFPSNLFQKLMWC